MGLIEDIYPATAIEYSRAFGIIQVMEARLLDPERLRRVAESEGLNGALGALSDTPYEADARAILDLRRGGGTVTAREISRIMSGEINRTFEAIGSITPERDILRMFQIYLDAHNLKLFLKFKFSEIGATGKDRRMEGEGIRYEDIAPNLYDYPYMELPARVVEDLKRKALTEVPRHISDPVLRAITEKAIAEIMAYESAHDYYVGGHVVDSMIDKETYLARKDMATRIRVGSDEERTLMDRYMDTMIDLTNITLFIRAGLMGPVEDYVVSVFIPDAYFTRGFVEGLVGQDYQGVIERLRGTRYRAFVEEFSAHGDLMRLDAMRKRELGRLMEGAKLFTLSPINIIHYLFLKEREIETLRGLLIAKAYDMGPERIKEVLPLG